MSQTTMATPRNPAGAMPGPATRGAYTVGGLRFDACVAALSSWFVGGACLDGWAHRHIPSLETFFTIWHAVLYSGFAATALFLVMHWFRHYSPGMSWRAALPDGYDLSLVGVAVFAAAGVGDMIWHILFGIEVSVDALLSPTHLSLVLGGILIVSGPLRAAWRRAEKPREWTAHLPMLLSFTLVLTLVTFITQFAHPIANASLVSDPSLTYSGADTALALGVSGMLLQAGLLTGLVLTTIRGLTLPFGGLALVFTLNAVAMSFMTDEFRLIPAATAAGLLADLLLLVLKPSVRRPRALRLFAFALPVSLYLPYFLVIALTSDIWWSIHAWLGSTVMAGFLGFGLSYLVIPPVSRHAE